MSQDKFSVCKPTKSSTPVLDPKVAGRIFRIVLNSMLMMKTIHSELTAVYDVQQVCQRLKQPHKNNHFVLYCNV